MLATKNCSAFLRNFAGLARRVIAVPISHQDKSFPADAIAGMARDVGIPAQSSTDVGTALQSVAQLKLELPPRILVTGSLYLAGEVLAANGTPPA
jgi:dihydrofolate synthase / folylpolyglutamate synthase